MPRSTTPPTVSVSGFSHQGDAPVSPLVSPRLRTSSSVSDDSPWSGPGPNVDDPAAKSHSRPNPARRGRPFHRHTRSDGDSLAARAGANPGQPRLPPQQSSMLPYTLSSWLALAASYLPSSLSPYDAPRKIRRTASGDDPADAHHLMLAVPDSSDTQDDSDRDDDDHASWSSSSSARIASRARRGSVSGTGAGTGAKDRDNYKPASSASHRRRRMSPPNMLVLRFLAGFVGVVSACLTCCSCGVCARQGVRRSPYLRLLTIPPILFLLYALFTINWPPLSPPGGPIPTDLGMPGPEWPPAVSPNSLGIAKYPTLVHPFSCDPSEFDFSSSLVGIARPPTSPAAAPAVGGWDLHVSGRPDSADHEVSFNLKVPPVLLPAGLTREVAPDADPYARRAAYPRSPGRVDVIFVSEKGEDAEVVNWFHASLWDAGYRGRVVVFSADPTRPALLSVHDHYRNLGADIECRPFRDPHAYGLVYARFFVYKRHMDTHWHLYRRVILSDYDVVWQRNPAEERVIGLGDDGLALFAEWGNFTMGECEHHERWIKCGETSGVWKKGTFDGMAPFARICAGVVVGHSFPVYVLLGHWTAQLLATNLCNDQGVLNYLYYTCRLSHDVPKLTVYRNEDGPGATLGTNPHVWYSRFGEILNANNTPYAFVHQYPYFPSILRLFRGRWPLLSHEPSPAYYSACRVRVLWRCWDTSDISAWPVAESEAARLGYMVLLRFENWIVRTFAWWKRVGEGKVVVKGGDEDYKDSETS
ncbi:hypothetical protein M427DRAFT_150985 [Gonapodya prolifera JEL478]|uniref:Uncharacterized protein n=1 Tax=Gonapodya prolifera (strain JEL478) TaxID=1344416 RepID=A0A139AYX1_GONPJ|nr:hypothetical protein M427DRAFT_150985 [Gonapodya prolifera JEL478]|eukprot:KXS21665.1 hypothetical protein M427DRAFT_150985 [Gonapodya prolifera JEL478]